MPKAKKSTEDKYVTQSQWAEGMDMIKDFFEKLFTEVQDVKHRLGNVEEDVKDLKTDVTGLKEDVKDLKRDTKEIKQNVEMHTESLALLTKDLRKTEKLENDIFKHEQRITKLEKKEKVKS